MAVKERTWKRFKAEGRDKPKHWTKASWEYFCAVCDRTFKKDGARRHEANTEHTIKTKRIQTGERKKDFSGERNPMRKLTEATVRQARRLYGEGWSTYDLAKRFEVTQQCVHAAVSGKTWKHLK